MCVLCVGKGPYRDFFYKFRISFEGFLLSFFSDLLPVGNYRFKSNRPSGASGDEVKELHETAKICISNPAEPIFAK